MGLYTQEYTFKKCTALRLSDVKKDLSFQPCVRGSGRIGQDVPLFGTVKLCVASVKERHRKKAPPPYKESFSSQI